MKSYFFALFVLLTAIVVSAQSTSPTPPDKYGNLFKISAAKFTRNTFQMGIEHYFTPATSLLFNAGLRYYDNDYEQEWSVLTEVQLKMHVFNTVKPKAYHSLYFSPYLLNHYGERQYNKYEYLNGSNSAIDGYDAVGAGILFGWSYTFAEKVNLDLYTGGGIQKSFGVDDTSNNYIFDYGYSGVVPRLGIDIGFWF